MADEYKKPSMFKKSVVSPHDAKLHFTKKLQQQSLPLWIQISVYVLCFGVYVVTILFLTMIMMVVIVSKDNEKEILLLFNPIFTLATFFFFTCLYVYGLMNAVSSMIYQCRRVKTKKKPRKKYYSQWSIYQTYSYYFSAHGLFGHLGKFYEIRLVVRELVEIPSATFQAWSMSYYITNPVIVHAFTLLIFANCISSPLTLNAKSRFVRRYTTLFLDVLFDFMFGVGLSIAIIVAKIYYYYINKSDHIENNVVWLTSAVLDGRQVFPTSLPDLFTKSLSFLFCYISLQSLIRFLEQEHFNQFRTSVIRRDRKKTTPNYTITLLERLTRMKSKCFTSRVLTLISISWGVSIIFVAGLGVWREICPKQCNLQIYPWLDFECKCVQYEVNCKNDNMPPFELQKALSRVSNNLIGLEINQCQLPSTNVSNILSQFQHLLILDIYFSKLTAWKGENVRLPANIVVVELKSNILDEIPEFLTSNIPDSLRYLRIIHCNVSSVPTGLAMEWRNLIDLSLAYSILSDFPVEASRLLNLQRLDLSYNEIIEVPTFVMDSILEKDGFQLIMDGNPFEIKRFGKSHDLQKLLKTVSIVNTPICARLTSNNATANCLLEDHILNHGNISNVCPITCAKKCSKSRGDYSCDHECNVESCSWDWGDCSKYDFKD